MRNLRDIAQNIATTISPSPSSSMTNNNNDMIIKATNNTHVWKSPIPYLFGGLALMLLLITLALILLLFSYRKHRDRHDDDEKNNKSSKSIEAADPEPQILVIMAGDEGPTYLATPVVTIALPSSNVCSCGRDNDDHQQIKL